MKQKKELYGLMFQIIIGKDGTKKAVLTDDPEKAAVILDEKGRRCPFCSSDKCLTNIKGESLILPVYFKEQHKVRDECYLYVLSCRKLGTEFLALREIDWKFLHEDRCMFCGSGRTEKISNVAEIRKELLSKERVKNYQWISWVVNGGKPGSGRGQIEGMTYDEQRILTLENPQRCLQCKRVFSFRFDKEGLNLFNKLIDEVIEKGVKRFSGYGVSEQIYDGKSKD